MLSRITVAIRESMAEVGDERRLLSGGTGFLAISGIVSFSEYIFRCVYVLSYLLWLCCCLRVEGEVFILRRGGLPLDIDVFWS